MINEYALTTDGRLTKCKALPENKGKYRCNHCSHYIAGENQDETIERFERINKMGLDKFIKVMKTLDNMLENLKLDEKIPIRAIGGFALVYHGVRNTGTGDIDTATLEYSDDVKALIVMTGAEEGIDDTGHWLNNDVVLGVDEDPEILNHFLNELEPTWEETSLDFRNIDLKIADLETCLKSKLMAVDIQYVMKKKGPFRTFKRTDKNRPQDLEDIFLILDHMGIKTPEAFKGKFIKFKENYETGYYLILNKLAERNQNKRKE